MTDEKNKEDKPIVIPTVPPADRERLNEGVDRSQNPPPPAPKPTTKDK